MVPTNLLPPDAQEPARGELIAHVGYDGLPNGFTSEVGRVISADPDVGAYEVLDKQNRTLIVVAASHDVEADWVEFLMD